LHKFRKETPLQAHQNTQLKQVWEFSMDISFETPDFENIVGQLTTHDEESDLKLENLKRKLSLSEDDFEQLKITYLILDRSPNDVITLLKQSVLFQKLEQFDKAFETCEKILSCLPIIGMDADFNQDLKSWIYAQCGDCKFFQKKFVESIKYYDRGLEIKQSANLLKQKTISLVRLKKFSEAEEFTKILLEKNSDSPDILRLQARCLMYQEKYVESLNLFNKLLIIEPKNIEILEHIATIHIELEKYQDAIKYFDIILEINPELDVEIQVSKFLISEEDTENLDLLTKVNEKIKTEPKFLIDKCMILHRMKKFKEFSECLNEVLNDHNLDQLAWYFNKQVNFSNDTSHSNFKN
jgi:tetratricopeptide (TPR) repeat protein